MLERAPTGFQDRAPGFMSKPSNQSVAIKELAAQLARAKVSNADANSVILARILGRRDRVRPHDEGLAGCLHAAAVLVRCVPRLGDDVGAELHTLAVRLVRIVAQEIETVLDGDTQAVSEDEPRTLQTLNDLSIGQFLIQLGFVTQDDIDEALDRVGREGNKRLGEVLCDMGRVTRDDVESAVRLRATLSDSNAAEPVQEAPTNAPPTPKRLGEIMIARRLIDRGQLERALKIQKKTGKWLGATLVELGIATWTDVTEALREQSGGDGATKRAG